MELKPNKFFVYVDFYYVLIVPFMELKQSVLMIIFVRKKS